MRPAQIIALSLMAATAAWARTGASSPPVLPTAIPAGTVPSGFRQNWFGLPCLPPFFEDEDPPKESLSAFPDLPLPLGSEKRWDLPSPVMPPEESRFPKLMSVLDLDEWRKQDDLRRMRELAGNLAFGLPLLLPQVILEEFLPRGVDVGPTTFLYRNPKDSKSMPLIIFDQALFHEGEFLVHLQAMGTEGPPDSLSHLEKHVLRRSLMSGFRATYALPSISMDQVLETAADQGVWGYLLVPAAGGTLLFLKGIDQKFTIDKCLKARVLVSSGRQWMHSVRASDGLPVLSCELNLFDLPISLILSMDMSNKGMSSQFVGLGTSLDVVEDLLGREQTRDRRPRN